MWGFNMWTSGETITHTRLEDINDKNQISGYIGLNGYKTITAPHRFKSFIGGFGNNYTIVRGNWQNTNGASQTDWDIILVSQAGVIENIGATNLDEIKWSNIILNAGSYTIKVSTMKYNYCGILELLHGTTSIGTSDLYNATVLYNQITTLTYSPVVRVTADFRLRANGKNASSTAYFIPFSRLEIIKTA